MPQAAQDSSANGQVFGQRPEESGGLSDPQQEPQNEPPQPQNQQPPPAFKDYEECKAQHVEAQPGEQSAKLDDQSGAIDSVKASDAPHPVMKNQVSQKEKDGAPAC